MTVVPTDLTANEGMYVRDNPHVAFGFHVRTAAPVGKDSPAVQQADAAHGAAVVVAPFNVLGGSAMQVVTTAQGLAALRTSLADAGNPATQVALLRRGGDNAVPTYNIQPKARPSVRNAEMVAR